jgi:hypothetical protein
MLNVSLAYKAWQKDAVVKEHLAFSRLGLDAPFREEVIFRIADFNSDHLGKQFNSEFSYDILQDCLY